MFLDEKTNFRLWKFEIAFVGSFFFVLGKIFKIDILRIGFRLISMLTKKRIIFDDFETLIDTYTEISV